MIRHGESAQMDLVAALEEEERILHEKLEAVRRTLAIYRRGNDGVSAAPRDPTGPATFKCAAPYLIAPRRPIAS